MDKKIVELTDEQLGMVSGGTGSDYTPENGYVEYDGKVVRLLDESDYQNVLSTYGANFGPSVGWRSLSCALWSAYYDWYYAKYNTPHPSDNR